MSKKYQKSILFSIIFVMIPFIVFASLKLENVYPRLGQLNTPIQVNLFGNGFDETTRVSIISDVGNKRLIIGSEHSRSSAYKISMFGNVAFVGCTTKNSTHGIQIIDVSIPENPNEVGFIETTDTIKALAIRGNTLYAACSLNDEYALINTYDIQIPAYPQFLSTIEISNSDESSNNIQDIDFWDNLILILFPDYIQLFQLKAGEIPAFIKLPDFSYAKQMVVSQGKAYVIDYQQGYLYAIVLSVTEPSIESIKIQGKPNDIVIQDNIAYLTNETGLETIHIENLQPLGAINTAGRSAGLMVRNQTAYVADSESGLQIIDVSNPNAPEQIGNVDTPGIASAVALFENAAIVADNDSGVQIIDILNPEISNLIASMNMNGDATGIQIVNQIAYVSTTGEEPGLTMIDISQINHPEVIGKTDSSWAYDVAVTNQIACVIDDGLLQLIDVRNPENPSVISRIQNSEGDVTDVSIVNNLAYLALGYGGLAIYDISDSTDPSLKAQMSIREMINLGSVIGITIDGNMAYLACEEGFQLINIANASLPEALGHISYHLINNERINIKMKVHQGYAYIVHCNELIIIDISNTWYLAKKGTITLSDCGNDISIMDNMAYVAMGGSGIAVIDIQNKDFPQIIGIVETPGNAMALEIMDNIALVADKSKGFVIVPLPVEIPKNHIQVNSSNQLTVNLPVDRIAQEGHYTIKVFNNNDNHELPGAFTFQDNLRTSKAIIIASSRTANPENDALWDAFKRVADNAYRTLLYQGFYRENIRYLRSDFCTDCENPVIDVDGDNLTDIYQKPSRTILVESLQNWASQTDDCVIYFVGHGLMNAFIINTEISTTELLTPELLNKWLILYQRNMPDDGRMVIIYDACRSGSFINEIKIPEAASINQKFIMITSANAFENAIFSDKGRDSFSYNFWNAIYDGDFLDDAFFYSQNKLAAYQTSLMDANGNKASNEKNDKIDANNIIIGRGYGNMPALSPICKNVNSDVPDEFENDDAFLHANLITNFDKETYSQCHTFHHAQDQDWFMFFGLYGTVYSLEINATQSSCDPMIEIFDIDGISLLVKKDNGIAGENEYLDWFCQRDGIYFIKISNNSNAFGQQNTYAIKMYEPYASFNGRISGRVYDAITLTPIENVNVRLEGKYTFEGRYKKNESIALYKIRSIIIGNYNLIAEAPGYHPFSTNLEIFQLKMADFDIHMNPLPLKCDINGDRVINMYDLILILQISCGFVENNQVKNNCADICFEKDGRFRVGLDEAVYVMKEISE